MSPLVPTLLSLRSLSVSSFSLLFSLLSSSARNCWPPLHSYSDRSCLFSPSPTKLATLTEVIITFLIKGATTRFPLAFIFSPNCVAVVFVFLWFAPSHPNPPQKTHPRARPRNQNVRRFLIFRFLSLPRLLSEGLIYLSQHMIAASPADKLNYISSILGTIWPRSRTNVRGCYLLSYRGRGSINYPAHGDPYITLPPL